jgi:hypothetical protein
MGLALGHQYGLLHESFPPAPDNIWLRVEALGSMVRFEKSNLVSPHFSRLSKPDALAPTVLLNKFNSRVLESSSYCCFIRGRNRNFPV